MRLLDARAFEFASFPDTKNRPPYTILSHTWGDDEITHQQFLQPGLAKHTHGYRKIKAACEKTIELGLEYVWIDTICIDKTNNTELSEAIKRMFEWYRASKVCLAYLIDVSGLNSGPEGLSSSRWFTRGWTLQELIAPQSMLFFDGRWKQIGSRADLAGQISSITGIGRVYLTGGHDTYMLLREASIAEKMSWASHRSTTKEEDMAYCLFGIFDVNIPLMYGEGGTQAFQRLQMEIAIYRFDPTLLVWKTPSGVFSQFLWGETLIESPSQSPWRSACAALVGRKHPWYADPPPPAVAGTSESLLAPSPRAFRGAQARDFLPIHRTWLVSANRLQISLPKSLDQEQYVVLPCFNRDRPHMLYAVPVLRQQHNADGSAYGRAEGPLMLVDSAAWDLWPQESITLDLSLRHVSASQERVPYILRTPNLPRGLRCSEVSINSRRQPYNSALKIKASKMLTGQVKVSLRLEDEASGEASVLEVAISSRKWHMDHILGIRELAQSWYGLTAVQCDYLPQTAPTVYFPVARQEKVLETTVILVELKQSLGLLSNIAFQLKASTRSGASFGRGAVRGVMSAFIVTLISLIASLLGTHYIFSLIRKVSPEAMPSILINFMESLDKNGPVKRGDYSASTFIGFLLLRHILISSLYFMPRNSALVFRQIWLINLLCVVGPMLSYEHGTFTYHSPSTLLFTAALGILMGYYEERGASKTSAWTGTNWLWAHLVVVVVYKTAGAR